MQTDSCWPSLRREAVLNRFPVSIIPKSKHEKRQTQVFFLTGHHRRIEWFHLLIQSEQTCPKNVMLIRARKNIIYIYIHISTYKEIKCCSTIGFYTVFLILEQSMLGAVCLSFFFSVLFHRRSVGLCIVGFVLSSCPIPPYSNLWRHKMMMKCGK